MRSGSGVSFVDASSSVLRQGADESGCADTREAALARAFAALSDPLRLRIAAHRARGRTGVRPDRPRTVLVDCFPSLQSAAGSGDGGEHAGGESARAHPAPGVRARLPGASGQYCAQGLRGPRRGLRSAGAVAHIRLTCGSKTPFSAPHCGCACESAHLRDERSRLSTGVSTVVEKFCGRLAGRL